MTKQQTRPLAIIVTFVISLVCFWYIDGENPKNEPKNVSSRVIGAPTQKAPVSQLRAPASVPQHPVIVVGTPLNSQPVWHENLQKSLKIQGGPLIKKIEIEKVDSFDWKVGKVDVRVDSIKVSLQNVKGHRSSFRALVDASSGKILETWDQPIIDNFSAKTGGTIKIDSRYHND